jgi:hypothetical protein
MPGMLGGNSRAYGVGNQSRFVNPAVLVPSKRSGAALLPGHPALAEGRTVFTSRVFDARDRGHVLIRGINNAKTGNEIKVGPWAGFRHYNLSLEERATCPRSCDNWAECFGNGMPVAVRFRYNDALLESLDQEIAELSRRHPGGFSVRLHILGDFPDVTYVRYWRMWLRLFPALHVWGYTAWPLKSPIGCEVVAANLSHPDRWVVRFSVADKAAHAEMQVSTTWVKPRKYAYDAATQSLICPQEIGKTTHCVTCGICWNPKLRHVRVRFLGHGGGRASTPKPTRIIPNLIPETPRPPPSGITDIAARGVTRLPAGRAGGV